MLNGFSSARPARLDASGAPGMPPRLQTLADKACAPITFAWWAYSQDAAIGQHRFHLRTLYRLAPAATCRADALERTVYADMTANQLREHVRAAEAPLLPALPPGHRWVGPQLVEDIGMPHSAPGAGKAGMPDLTPQCNEAGVVSRVRYMTIGKAASLSLPAVLYFAAHVAVALQKPWIMVWPTSAWLAVIVWAFHTAETAAAPRITTGMRCAGDRAP